MVSISRRSLGTGTELAEAAVESVSFAPREPEALALIVLNRREDFELDLRRGDRGAGRSSSALRF